MLTVKLQRGHYIKIVEADSVEVFPAGPRERCADHPKDRPNDIREVSVVRGDRNEVFYIGNNVTESPAWWGEAVGLQLFDRSYIENQAGKTVEIIRPY